MGDVHSPALWAAVCFPHSSAWPFLCFLFSADFSILPPVFLLLRTMDRWGNGGSQWLCLGIRSPFKVLGRWACCLLGNTGFFQRNLSVSVWTIPEELRTFCNFLEFLHTSLSWNLTEPIPCLGLSWVCSGKEENEGTGERQQEAVVEKARVLE